MGSRRDQHESHTWRYGGLVHSNNGRIQRKFITPSVSITEKKMEICCLPADAQIEGGKEYKIALGVSDFDSICLSICNQILRDLL